jgi:hypothetical protein
MKLRSILILAAIAASTFLFASPASARTQGGYWMLASDGHVYGFGGAADLGSPWSIDGHVRITPTPTGNGYWVLHRSGLVDAFGDAADLGNGPTMPYPERYTTMAATPSGAGYWLFTDKGRVLRFGDATFYGDLAGTPLNGPVLDAIATPTGNGYYMVGSDGGVFTFGGATFHGSTGDKRLNKPVMSLAPDADGAGYWLVASDGGIFAFDAPFYGSLGAIKLNKPISGIVASPTGRGYLMVAADGGVFAFGDVPFHGSLGNNPPAYPVVAIAAIGNPPPPPVMEWASVAQASGQSNSTSSPFHLEANLPVRMTYSCLTPTGEGSGCLIEVKNMAGSSISESWMQPNPNERGTVIINPKVSGDYYIHGDTYDWRQQTTWDVRLEQQRCTANCA